MRKLTPKQTLFLNYLLAGSSKIESYKKSYPNAKGSDKSIQVAASKVFNSTHFQHYYSQATKEIQGRAMYNRDNAVDDLKLIIEAAKADIKKHGLRFANSTAIIKSVEVLNTLLMLGTESTERLKLEYEKLELAKSKLQKDNNDLQKENANLLRELINNASINEKTE